jgi:hypothetical protein
MDGSEAVFFSRFFYSTSFGVEDLLGAAVSAIDCWGKSMGGVGFVTPVPVKRRVLLSSSD